VTNAFLYLQVVSLKNRLLERVRRLRQPKYFFGAVVGAAYFYFFFFRRLFVGSGRATVPGATVLPPEFAPDLASLGALVVFVIVALAWIVPSSRAALQFSEPEVAFLFPAPVTRRRLIHFKLLRSQLAILVSTFFIALIFRRASYFGGNPLTHAAGWWVILSTLSLHFTAASFAREQLLSLGVHPNRRRAVALGIVLAVIAGCAWWIRDHVSPPVDENLVSTTAMIHYFGRILGSAPIGWILAPFALVVRPYFAPDPVQFLSALGPALVLMGAHYWWVTRADVAFEEASIDRARKQAERLAAVRSGDWQAARNQPSKPRPAAFTLAPQGFAVVAFLWKNLIALGPFFRLRTWLALAGLIFVFHAWANLTALNARLYLVISIAPLGFGAWLLIVGPMVMRRDVRLMVTHFDLLKGYPLRGWQVVLGSLLCPIVIIAAVEWLALLFGAPGLIASGRGPAVASSVLGLGTLGIALIVPPLAGLMLGIPFAATLYFPAWIESSASRGGGIEVMGQRLIFFAGYMVVLIVALLPAALCGGVAAVALYWLVGTVAAVMTAAAVASLILCAEFGALVWWLGERFEKFDLSREMPR